MAAIADVEDHPLGDDMLNLTTAAPCTAWLVEIKDVAPAPGREVPKSPIVENQQIDRGRPDVVGTVPSGIQRQHQVRDPAIGDRAAPSERLVLAAASCPPRPQRAPDRLAPCR